MTNTVKIPEPFKKQGQQIGPDGGNHATCDLWDFEQLKQYGDDRAREALEMAAEEARYYETVYHSARAIRALKELIK